MKYLWLSLVLMTVCVKTSFAEQSAGETIHNLLISPEVLIQHREEIALTDEQVQQIQTRLEQARRQMQDLQERANTAMDHLAKLLSSAEVDEEAALKQLDDMVTIERDQKRLHLALRIQLRSKLTPEQRRAAAKIGQTAIPNDALERRLKAKLAQIERAVQVRVEQGRPPFEALGLMQTFPDLMQKGQVPEAESLLDRVIIMLGLEKPNEGANKLAPVEPPASLAESFERPMPEAGLRKRYSPKDIRSEFAALQQEDVAWRQIAWKTCLLDGVKASREQNKPLMLWVFIDRPVDDQRC